MYNNIFPDDIYVTFRSDLSDFDEKLFHYLGTKEERNRIIEKARFEVQKNHTWQIRITNLLSAVNKLSLRTVIA